MPVISKLWSPNENIADLREPTLNETSSKYVYKTVVNLFWFKNLDKSYAIFRLCIYKNACINCNKHNLYLLPYLQC